MKHGPTDDGHFWFEYAALLLLSGDRPGYVKECAHLVDLCGTDKGPRSYHVARACTLAPHAVADMSLPGRLAEKELQDSREFWSLTEQGALAYRAGRFQQAVPLFERSLRAEPEAGPRGAQLAVAGPGPPAPREGEEARRWLERPRRGSTSTVTGCRPGPKRSSGCTCTIGWKHTSCAARRKC